MAEGTSLDTGGPGERDYSIRVIRQAVVETSADFAKGCLRHSNEGAMDIPIVFTLLSAPSGGVVRHYLVDCGVGPEPRTGGRPPPRFWISPGKALARFGIDPGDVEWLLLTHLHRDHAGNLLDFPTARVGLQRAELDGWLGVLTLPSRYFPLGDASWAHRAINADTVGSLQKQVAHGTCVLFDGDRAVAPGLAVVLAKDSHTFGSQLVTVSTPDGPYIIGGDNVFCYSNLDEMWPAGAGQGNQFNVLRVLAWVRETVNDQYDRVVPGHDMAVFESATTRQLGGTLVSELRIGTWDRSWGEDADTAVPATRSSL